jgi:hypothetical protein
LSSIGIVCPLWINPSQSLKARCFSSSGNLNGTCKENEFLQNYIKVLKNNPQKGIGGVEVGLIGIIHPKKSQSC